VVKSDGISQNSTEPRQMKGKTERNLKTKLRSQETEATGGDYDHLQ